MEFLNEYKVFNGYSYTEFMEKYRDPRVDGWLLMSSPLPTFLICLSYYLLVKKIGPSYMESRPPYKLNKLLILYNLFQVIFSSYLFYEWGASGWFGKYSYRCQPVDYSDSPEAIRMLNVSWWYYISKFTEFFDTFFFVLRKKQRHVSLLHVIHHGCMPMSVWFGAKFTPGGHSTFFGFLNTFVHIIMYFYYMMAACGPRVQRYLWWKKYLTGFQMVQFILIAAHAFQLLFIECDYPKAFVWWIGGHGLLFLVLFANFYRESYNSNRKRIAMATSAASQGRSNLATALHKSLVCNIQSSKVDDNMNYCSSSNEEGKKEC